MRIFVTGGYPVWLARNLFDDSASGATRFLS